MWFSKRVGRPMSESTQAMFKGEDSGNSGNSLVHSSSQSLGPGGRKLRTVDRMDGLFEDEEGNMSRRQEKEFGEEGDMDEMVFEEEFADDDEKMEVDGDDEEAKELEVSGMLADGIPCTHSPPGTLKEGIQDRK